MVRNDLLPFNGNNGIIFINCSHSQIYEIENLVESCDVDDGLLNIQFVSDRWASYDAFWIAVVLDKFGVVILAIPEREQFTRIYLNIHRFC